jgi:hypothetical protein
MTVRLYKSTDASAPSLTGQVGSLIALLDACLVNGYGAQSAAGWTKPYTGTNKAIFRMGTTGNTGFYLNVQDNAPGTGGAKEARVWGYEVATAQDTGTGQFPTVAQVTTGSIIRKSNTADATARAWYLIADSSCFHLFVETGDWVSPTYAMSFSFGDFFSYKSGDAYNCAIMSRLTENTTSGFDWLPIVQGLYSIINGGLPGHYLARHWTQTGGSVNFGKTTSGLGIQSQASTQSTYYPIGDAALLGITYPNGPDGGLLLAPLQIGHNSGLRGYVKGLWAPCHAMPLSHGDTFSGTGNMTGKTFLALNIRAPGTSDLTGQMIIETSDTWS